jgi:hypothetical protein
MLRSRARVRCARLTLPRPGDLCHHAQVVRDDQHAHVHLRLQHPDQLQDLRRDRHVERCRRFILDHQRRMTARAIAIIARCRMPPDFLVDVRRRAGRAGSGMLTCASISTAWRRVVGRPMPCSRPGDLFAHRQQRVESPHRLLEDHADLVAADRPHRRLGRQQQATPAEPHAATRCEIRLAVEPKQTSQVWRLAKPDRPPICASAADPAWVRRTHAFGVNGCLTA